MSSIESSKMLAGVGSILLIIGSIPYGGASILGIVGVILFMMGVKGFANYYQDNTIYENALRGVIYYIIAAIAIAVATIMLTISAFTIFFLGIGLVIFVAGLIAAFIFYLMAAQRLRRTFSTLAQKTGEHSFETAGYLLWIGAILTIILVGAILILVAWIFATIGFFSMKTAGQQPSSYAPPPPPPPTEGTQAQRFCPNCGAAVQQNTAFCPHCGKQLPA